MQNFSVSEALQPYTDEKAERPRNRRNYRAPLLLIKEFMGEDGRPIAAVEANRDMVFTKGAISGAALPSTHIDIAYMLAVILNSALASWFFLMTSSRFGLPKRHLLLNDTEDMPIPDLEKARYSDIGLRLINFGRRLHERPPNDADWCALDEEVFNLYNLDSADRIVIRDGLFRARWQWKSGRLESAAAACPGTYIRDYARAFVAAIDVWLSAANRHRMRGEVFNLPQSAPLRIVRFVLEERKSTPSAAEAPEIVSPDGSLRQVLDRIGERLDVPLGTRLIGQRALRIYGPDEVVIVKPAARRHWMGVSALEDADAVLVESISGIGT